MEWHFKGKHQKLCDFHKISKNEYLVGYFWRNVSPRFLYESSKIWRVKGLKILHNIILMNLRRPINEKKEHKLKLTYSSGW